MKWLKHKPSNVIIYPGSADTVTFRGAKQAKSLTQIFLLMTNQGERSFMNSEAHRLKNRMRQQRYRARKREEKAKRNGETVLPVELFFTGLPCVTNGFPLLRNDTSALNLEASGARNWTTSVEFGHGHSVREGCSQSAVEAESFQAKTIMGQQSQQQHSDFQFFGTDAEDDADIAPGDRPSYYSHKIVEPLSKMQNEYGVNSLMMQGDYVMNPLDQRQHSVGLNDIIARRLKNRERQRRYRARKRLEADTRSSYLLSQSTPLQLESELTGAMDKCMARTHCPRDWKQDARKAQALEGLDVTSTELLLPAPNVELWIEDLQNKLQPAKKPSMEDVL
ncbi:hypothetical protein NE237_028403 [Protea cynaroides]|uniref:Uncharacterized protein n=1 Tax=Protea cynaroides TaxID=273540 RepID=A0A9Q0JTT9_9MAGN|nr:hypothetical protein NE237_028403 [Protea cynaroides]